MSFCILHFQVSKKLTSSLKKGQQSLSIAKERTVLGLNLLCQVIEESQVNIKMLCAQVPDYEKGREK